jgi:hypothetical protein
MKPKTNQPKKHTKLRISTTLLILVVLAVGGTFLYKNHQKQQAIAKERSEYAQAEKDLDSLLFQLATKFGQPVSATKDKSCGYASSFNEFAQHGDLYCGITETIAYETANLDSATQQAQAISGQIDSMGIFKTGASSSVFAHDTSPPPTQVLSVHISNKTELNCSSDYTYFLNSTANGYPKISDTNANGLLIQLSCGSRPAKAAYYPFKSS